MDIDKKIETAIWIGKSLFDRGKATGSSANMSFKDGNHIYITKSGSCFGRLTKEEFAIVSLEGVSVNEVKSSKEFPLHQIFYKYYEEVESVIHVHSPYATLWSCIKHENKEDTVPRYTPYLEMKLGKVPLIPYAMPGSKELFQHFEKRIHLSKGFLMQNHGIIVGSENLMDAFYIIEEMEENMKIAWEMQEDDKGIKI